MSFKKFKQRLDIKNAPSTVDEAVNDVEQVAPVQHVDIEELTKKQLDRHAIAYNIKLDRRQSKSNMIKEFLEKLKGGK